MSSIICGKLKKIMRQTNQQLRRAIGARLSEIRGAEDKKSFWPRYKLDAAKMGRYENAKEIPTVEKLVEICEAIDISPTWLLFGLGRRRLTAIAARTLDEKDAARSIIEGFARDRQRSYRPPEADEPRKAEKNTGSHPRPIPPRGAGKRHRRQGS